MIQLQSTLMLLVLLVSSAMAGGNEWRGLKPLKSTRADVEKLLGASKTKYNIYETEKEKVSVWYSKGRCNEDKPSGWDVPKDTILTFIVVPKADTSVSSFLAQYSEPFKREVDYEVKGYFLYYNEDSSVKFEGEALPDGGERVTYITYSPAREDRALLCENKLN